MPSSSDKIALFIDGANLYATAKTLGFDIDYKCLPKEFKVAAPCCALSITPQSLKIRTSRRSAP